MDTPELRQISLKDKIKILKDMDSHVPFNAADVTLPLVFLLADFRIPDRLVRLSVFEQGCLIPLTIMPKHLSQVLGGSFSSWRNVLFLCLPLLLPMVHS